MSQPRVAVVGGSGAVGRTILRLLRERSFPAASITALASSRSAGTEIEGVVVEDLELANLSNFDLALFSAGSTVSAEWGPKFVEAGAVVVDNSSHWRMDPKVPLVVPEVNPEAVEGHSGIVANPNCSTMQAMVVLKPILDRFGLDRVIFSTYQAVSGTGVKALAELESQARAVLDGAPVEPAAVYPHQIAFNVIPQVESFQDGDDYTTEERKMMAETRKILSLPALPVTATCARVPVMNGHSESVNIQTSQEASPDEIRALLANAPGVLVADDPAAGVYPMAIDGSGRDEVLVGRIRVDQSAPRSLNLWIVGDNLRKGAATNAVQVAELLVQRGL
ncbi:MAG: aspartate-semialdehyde dehydrogenase [Actinobacteria bacterium]|uniref:aspartate-semialdehyde dehydrogenase n=1 Tax=freshwater metagenome TaxID=449393 RepID=A0A6J7DIF7_9ZZZZ|nr:aspartate-semialdehyde dehydrogenase [Actinomycetota bacterium]